MVYYHEDVLGVIVRVKKWIMQNKNLTPHQHVLLLEIRKHWAAYSRAPTVAELSKKLDQSKQNIYQHLRKLNKLGYSLVNPGNSPEGFESFESTLTRQSDMNAIKKTGAIRRVPILGQTAAGAPIYADQHVEGGIWFEWSSFDILFALRVRGHSMIKTGIMDGDIVILRQQATYTNGDIVLALIDRDSSTIKRLKQQGNTIGLIPENDDLQPTYYTPDRVILQGKVIESRRSYDFY